MFRFVLAVLDSKQGVWTQAGKADFDYLEKKAIELGEPKVASAKQVRQTSSYVWFFFGP